MAPALLSRRAEKDLYAAVRWIERDNHTAALGLIEAVQAAAERIGNHPHIGVVRPDLTTAHHRFVTLAGYPYMVVYNPDRSPPVIVRVLHGARDIPFVLGRI